MELRVIRIDLHWIRRRQRVLARAVLALFCVVWLQAALAPCAMAFAPDGMAGGGEEHCGYCPPELRDPSPPIDQGGCVFPDDPQVDTRVAAGTAPLALALPVVAFVLDLPAGPPMAVPAVDRPPDPSGVPIPVSYCRFLK